MVHIWSFDYWVLFSSVLELKYLPQLKVQSFVWASENVGSFLHETLKILRLFVNSSKFYTATCTVAMKIEINPNSEPIW